MLKNWASRCTAKLCRAIPIEVNTGAGCIIKKHQTSLSCSWPLAYSFFKSSRSLGFLMSGLTCKLFHISTWNSGSFISWAWWAVFFSIFLLNLISKAIEIFLKTLWRVIFNGKLLYCMEIAQGFNTYLKHLITYSNFILCNLRGLILALWVTLCLRFYLVKDFAFKLGTGNLGCEQIRSWINFSWLFGFNSERIYQLTVPSSCNTAKFCKNA